MFVCLFMFYFAFLTGKTKQVTPHPPTHTLSSLLGVACFIISHPPGPFSQLSEDKR